MTRIKIVENFLSKRDFQMLSNVKIPKVEPNNIKIFHNRINKDNTVFCECLSKSNIVNLQKKYHKKAMKILSDLFPEKVKLYDYSEFQIIVTGLNYKFPIHDDTPNKLLSGVVYISPKKNKGTMFFDNQRGKNLNIIKWKQNRAVFFSRKERESWHSYEGDKKSQRIVLVYNLMTKKIKDVCEIENKNYYYSLLRFKLNPYIYKFFKKVF